ncbi:MAG: hypothetical protein ABWZ15_13015 [Acidimicrobiia bacterium]
MQTTLEVIEVRWEPCAAFASDGDGVCRECGWLDDEHPVELARAS